MSRASTSRRSPGIRSERIGFVFQNFNLLARTSALENIALPLFYAASGPPRRAARLARARDALTLIGLGDRAQSTPGAALGRPAAARRHRARPHQRARAC